MPIYMYGRAHRMVRLAPDSRMRHGRAESPSRRDQRILEISLILFVLHADRAPLDVEQAFQINRFEKIARLDHRLVA